MIASFFPYPLLQLFNDEKVALLNIQLPYVHVVEKYFEVIIWQLTGPQIVLIFELVNLISELFDTVV